MIANRRVSFDFQMAQRALDIHDALVAQGYEPLGEVGFDAEQYTIACRPADTADKGISLAITGYHDDVLLFIACLPPFEGGKPVRPQPAADHSGAKPGARYPVVVPRD